MKRKTTSSKASLLLLLALCLCSVSYGQSPTFREWWRQKKVTKAYMAKQIGLLQVQLEYVKKGVKIVQAGLTTYENIANGNFNLSRDFFSSLKNVKPAIANSAKVADILVFQSCLIKESSKVRSFCRNKPNLSATEIRYVLAIYTNLIKLSDMNIAELVSLTRSGDSEMSDDERIKRINKVHAQAGEQLVFARLFSSELTLLSKQRSSDTRQVNTSQKLNAII